MNPRIPVLCAIIESVFLVAAIAPFLDAADAPWPALRMDAAGTGASPAVGKPFRPEEEALKRSIAELTSADPRIALRARFYLKRAGADAVPHLKASIAANDVTSQACMQILDRLHEPEVLWKLNADAFFTGSPVLDESNVYAADRDGNLYAADKLTGKLLWKIKLPALTNATPVAKGDSVYIGCHDGSVLRVAKADGTTRWTFKADTAATTESWQFVWDGVAVDDRIVCFGTASGRIYALDTESGNKLWGFEAAKMTVDGKEQDGRFYGIPALADGKVYLGSQNGIFYCLNADDGSKTWEHKAAEAITRSPAIWKDLVFFVTDGHNLVALDRGSGQAKWSFASERTWTSHPTVYGDHVLACGQAGRLYVLNAADGRAYWSGNAPAEITGTLPVVNDRIYYNTGGMLLGCINFRSSGRVWTFTTPAGGKTKAPSPAVDDGIVYITTRDTLRRNNLDEVAISCAIVAVAEPSDNLYGLNPLPVAWGLNEVHRRVNARHGKPYHLLKDENGYFQPETLIFTDPETGAEITRFSDDASSNYHHSSINRPSYNANGSYLVLHSSRTYYPGRFILRPDGSRFRRIDLDPFVLNYGIHPCWDRKEPNIVYTTDSKALYRVNVETLKTTKVCGLPDPDRRKSIFSYPSADNKWLLMLAGTRVYFPRTDGGEVKTVDLPNPRAKELAPAHDPKWEQQGAHDIYFSLSPENTFIFNYGPTTSVGEGIFYEMDMDGKLLRVVYPFMEGRNNIYYSHPGWRQDGQKVAYFGDGGAGLGYGFFMRDRDGSNPVRLSPGGMGGHCGWDNYDDEWVFASPSVGREPNEFGGTISRFRTDGSQTAHVLCDARPHVAVNASYSAIPRVAPSPDGTKAVFSSDMLGNTDIIDMYSVVAQRPDPPVGVALDGETLSWKPPRLHREIMGYHVYRSHNGVAWELVNGEPTRDTRAEIAGEGLYAVTSVEWSGLESLALSNVVVSGTVASVLIFEAELAEYAIPVKEVRSSEASNEYAVENSAEEPGAVTLVAVAPADGEYTALLRIRDGAWRVTVDGKDSGIVAERTKQWTWAKLPGRLALKKGPNPVLLNASRWGAAVDKMILAADPDFRAEGKMLADTKAPSPPNQLAAERLDQALIRLTWTAPGDADVRYYNIYYSSTGAAPSEQHARIASPPGGESRYIDFAPRPRVAAHYAITAVDRFGNESEAAQVSVPAD